VGLLYFTLQTKNSCIGGNHSTHRVHCSRLSQSLFFLLSTVAYYVVFFTLAAAFFPLAFSGLHLAGWFLEIPIFLGCGPA